MVVLKTRRLRYNRAIRYTLEMGDGPGFRHTCFCGLSCSWVFVAVADRLSIRVREILRFMPRYLE